jgi:hypothetical protein
MTARERRRLGKLRGGRRHFARIKSMAQSLAARLAAGETFDLWHEHVDYLGYGCRNPRRRHQHRVALLEAFDIVRAAAIARGPEVQVFVSLAPAESSEQDALYVHSAAETCYRYDGVRWLAEIPGVFKPLVGRRLLRAGQYERDGERWWVVVAPDDPAIQRSA